MYINYTISRDYYVSIKHIVKNGDKRTMRNIDKNIEQGHEIIRKHERADLTVSELHQFYETFSKTAEEKGVAEGIFELITDVFHMGVAVGARNS